MKVLWTCCTLMCCILVAAAKRRIFGGEQVKPGEFTYQVAIGYKTGSTVEIVCGGSLIHPRFILTAAHCLEMNRPMIAMLGSQHLNLKSGNWYNIGRVIVPADWKNGSYINDIMLAVLKKPVKLIQGKISVVNLPKVDNELNKGTTLWMSGWGLVNRRQSAQKLKKIRLVVVDKQKCKNYWHLLENTRFCAYSDHKKWGTCGGDSGGPLVYKNIIYGILSFGTRDCSLNKPEVYTNVKVYASWIKEQIKNYAHDSYLK